MPERTLVVRIIGDDRSLHQAFTRSAKSGKQLEVGVSGIGAGIARSLLPAAAAALSVRQAFKLAGDSVADASAINEEVAKSGEVFKGASKEVVAWSETTAASIGVSKRAALEATGIFGNLFRTVGLAPAAAADLSRSLVELAADMASFNNASPVEVLEAIRSGLVGEAEPLRRYGVRLSEARVQQEALVVTGKANIKSLTELEKAQARYNIILTDTRIQQGDVSRTSGSLANQQRQLQARLDDLSGNIGGVLIPVLTDLARTANLAFAALDRIGSVEIPGAGQLSSLYRWVSGYEILARALDVVEGKQKAVNAAIATGAVAGPMADAHSRLAQAEAAGRVRAQRQGERAAKDFEAFVKGMNLKIDKAGLTAGVSDDLAALRELERAIQRRIRSEGKTFDLVRLLTDTRLRIAAVASGQAAEASSKISDAYGDTLDALALKLDIAKSTRQFGDDLRVLRQLERIILERIRAEGRTTELLRQLFENRQEQARTLTAQRNAAQFEALGLTAEGEERVAGRRALLRRARSLQEQIKGTILDTPKTRQELRRIVGVLRSATKGVGRDVRRAILEMLNDISGALEGPSSKESGPMTKFAKRGIEGLVRGLGLTEEQVKEIRQRFSQFSRFDVGGARALGPTTPRGPSRRPGAREADDRDIIVNVFVDGQRVEAMVTKRQEKKRGRNAPSRRGVRPGI